MRSVITRTPRTCISNCMVSGLIRAYDRRQLSDGRTSSSGSDFTTGHIGSLCAISGVWQYHHQLRFDVAVVAPETVDGGIMEDIVISNITMHVINRPSFAFGCKNAQSARQGCRQYRAHGISNLNCLTSIPFACILISGIPQAKIEESVSAMSVSFQRGGNKEWAGIETPEKDLIRAFYVWTFALLNFVFASRQ